MGKRFVESQAITARIHGLRLLSTLDQPTGLHVLQMTTLLQDSILSAHFCQEPHLLRDFSILSPTAVLTLLVVLLLSCFGKSLETYLTQCLSFAQDNPWIQFPENDSTILHAKLCLFFFVAFSHKTRPGFPNPPHSDTLPCPFKVALQPVTLLPHHTLSSTIDSLFWML